MTKLPLISAGTLGLAGLVSAGLLAMPVSSNAASGDDDAFAKRDDDVPELVLVADDDDDDTNAKDQTRTRTRTQGQTRTRTGNDTNSRSRNDNTGTGTRTGRDDSRDRKVKDWTQDGAGDTKRDWSANHTNDRSRNNTRR
jgi:hypothetical protein